MAAPGRFGYEQRRQVNRFEGSGRWGSKQFGWCAKFHSVFVGNLNPNTSIDTLWKFFSSFGVVVHANIPQRRSTWGGGSSYGFVRYRKEDEATLAIKKANDNWLENYRLRVEKADEYGGRSTVMDRRQKIGEDNIQGGTVDLPRDGTMLRDEDRRAGMPPTNRPSCNGPRNPIERAKVFPSPRNIIPIAQSPRNRSKINSKRRFNSSYSVSESVDIEDLAGPECSQKKRINRESFLNRFKRDRKLAVTDVTGTEWCERQMEYKLLEGTPKASNAMKAGDAPHAAIEDEEWCEKQMVYRLKDGKPKASKAMKAGIARHAELEDEVSKKVKVHVTSSEDVWALKFLNFILCSNQLLFYGLTRELPLVSFEEGVWIDGVIDEIRMSVMDTERYATLVDTKTRQQAKLPAEAQRRNGRLQLMCYKRMWDNLVADKFPVEQFYNSFPLNRYRTLSAQIREHAAESGITAENLNDLVLHFRNACSLLPPAHDQLLLRYEWQEDQSLIGEDKFDYNEDWLAHKLESCLEFWRGEREPVYPPSEELWKCYSCKFFSKCRPNANVESSAREEIA